MAQEKHATTTGDIKYAILQKLNDFLSECRFDEINGESFSGEAYAYNRVKKFIQALPEN